MCRPIFRGMFTSQSFNVFPGDGDLEFVDECFSPAPLGALDHCFHLLRDFGEFFLLLLIGELLLDGNLRQRQMLLKTLLNHGLCLATPFRLILELDCEINKIFIVTQAEKER